MSAGDIPMFNSTCLTSQQSDSMLSVTKKRKSSDSQEKKNLSATKRRQRKKSFDSQEKKKLSATKRRKKSPRFDS
jgi:hypothetical protein